MAAVALAALATFAWREYQAWLRRNTFSDPVFDSQLNARFAEPQFERTFTPGKAIPVTITYDFRLSKPEPGVSCLVLGMVWLEDLSTKMPVESYAFDANLTGGAREACAGTMTWDVVVPRPGRYQLRFRRFQRAPGEEFQGKNGGSTFCEFIEERRP